MNITKTRVGKLVGSLLVACSAVASAPAFAQTAGSGGVTTVLEEVIVTARKREESLQSVPVAVTVISAEQLREKNIQTVNDLAINTPGLMVRAGGGTRTSAEFFLRGQGATFGSAAAVVTYFAEAPGGGAAVGGLGDRGQFFDLASVQVLKGPQGTLFGRSSTGGAVLVSPARPSNEFAASIQAAVGNLNYTELNGVVNIPLAGGKLAVRIAANSVRRDGFTQSIFTGQKMDDRHRDSLRLGLLYKPSDKVSNYLLFQHNQANEANAGVVLLKVNRAAPLFNPGVGGFVIAGTCARLYSAAGPFGANPAAIPGCIAQRTARLTALYQGLLAQEARLVGENSREVRRTGSAVNSVLAGNTESLVNITTVDAGTIPFLGEVSFKNIFSTARSSGVKSLRDLAGSELPSATVWTSATIDRYLPSYNDVSKGKADWLDYYTEEFQILGTVHERHNWLLGIYYETSKRDLSYPAIFSTFGNVLQQTIDTPQPVNAFTSDSYSLVKGYFGQFTLDLSSMLQGVHFTGGYRWSSAFRRNTSLAASFDANGTMFPGAVTGRTRLDDQAPSWNVSVDYQINERLLTYLAHRRGFKPGGINIVDLSIPGAKQTFTPETLDDIELGAKWDWTAGGVSGRSNVAIYTQKYNDIQRAEFIVTATGSVSQQTNNIATAKIDGLEMENILQLTNRLQLDLNYAYINPKYTKWPGDTNGPAPGGIPLIESPYPGTPKSQGTLAVRYRMPLGAMGELTGSADYYRQTDVELSDTALSDGQPIPREPGWGNLNLRLDWSKIAGRPLDAALFVRNATDGVHKEAANSLFASVGFVSALYNEPRTFGVEVRYRIGGKP
jgi:iron complex outermembrane receptor protein